MYIIYTLRIGGGGFSVKLSCGVQWNTNIRKASFIAFFIRRTFSHMSPTSAQNSLKELNRFNWTLHAEDCLCHETCLAQSSSVLCFWCDYLLPPHVLPVNHLHFLWNKFDPNKSYNNGKSVYLQKNHWDCKMKLYQAHSIVYSFVKFLMFVQCFLSLGFFVCFFLHMKKKTHLCFKWSLVQPFSIEERGDHCIPRGQMLILCEM